MKTDNNNRDIPPMPGGGSWTFDYDLWDWVSNHPVPLEEVAGAPAHIEFKAEE